MGKDTHTHTHLGWLSPLTKKNTLFTHTPEDSPPDLWNADAEKLVELIKIQLQTATCFLHKQTHTWTTVSTHTHTHARA